MKTFKTVSKVNCEVVTKMVLAALFVLQFSIICVFNLILLKDHLGYDCSVPLLKATLMWKQLSIVPTSWIDQTSPFLDSGMPIAALFYGMFGNIFVAYGMANILVLSLILLSFYYILLENNISISARLIGLNFIVCPFLINGFIRWNDLSYYSNMLGGPAFYNLRVLVFLLIILFFDRLSKGKISIIFFVFICLICVLCGISSGVFIFVVCLLPIFCYYAYKAAAEDNIKVFIKKDLLLLLALTLCVLGGKVIAQSFLNINVIDSSRSWTPISKLWINFGAVFQGFVELLGALPVTDAGVKVLSPEGMARIFPLGLIFFIGFCFARSLKDKSRISVGTMLKIIICCNVIILALFNVRYGAAIFETRYLLPCFISLILLSAIEVDKIIASGKKVLSSFLVCVSMVCLLGTDIVSDINYWKTKDIGNIGISLVDYIKETDIRLVHLWGMDLTIVGRNMRVYDLDRVYKVSDEKGGYHHWGDYTYYDDPKSYKGHTLLIANKPISATASLFYKPKVVIGGLTIYEASCNAIDFVTGREPVSSAENFGCLPTKTAQKFEVVFKGTALATLPGRVGAIADGERVSDGKEGFLIYGPYIPVQKGKYRLIIKGSKKNVSRSYVDVVSDYGRSILAKKIIDPTESNLCDMVVNIPKDLRDLEVRVWNAKSEFLAIHEYRLVPIE